MVSYTVIIPSSSMTLGKTSLVHSSSLVCAMRWSPLDLVQISRMRFVLKLSASHYCDATKYEILTCRTNREQ